jgi:adenylate cyclase
MLELPSASLNLGKKNIWSKTTLGYLFKLDHLPEGIRPPRRPSRRPPWLKRSALSQVKDFGGGVYHATDVILPPLSEVSSGYLGFLNVSLDHDGKVRRLPLVIEYMGDYYPSFSLLLIAQALEIPLEKIQIEFGENAAKITLPIQPRPLYIHTDRHAQILINTPTDKDIFEQISVHRWLDWKQAGGGLREAFPLRKSKGRLLLVGPTEPKAAQPVSPLESLGLPLVFLQASAIDTILSQRFIRPVAFSQKTAILALIVLCLFCLCRFLRPIWGFLSSLLILAGYCLFAYRFFCLKGILLPLTEVLLLGITASVLVTVFRVSGIEREKRRIRRILGRYVSQGVLHHLLKDTSNLRLGGERRLLTVLFADIRHFTLYCEKHTPEEIVDVLNEFFDAMTKVIIQHRGTLDKYVGDQIIALFGTPGQWKEAEHAICACRAALEMCAQLDRLREKWLLEGKEPIEMGIGITTGEVVVGNVGSSRYMNYTAIGRTMNIGARVERLTRQLERRILITESTRRLLPRDWKTNLLTQARIKGIDIPILIYEISQEKGDGLQSQ